MNIAKKVQGPNLPIGTRCIFAKSGSLVTINSAEGFDKQYGDFFYSVSRVDTGKRMSCQSSALVIESEWAALYPDDYEISPR